MNGKKTMKAWQMIVAVVLLAAMMITIFLPAFHINGKSFRKAVEKVVSGSQLDEAIGGLTGYSMDDLESEIDKALQEAEQENNVKVSSISVGNIMIKSADKFFGTDAEDADDEATASVKSGYNTGRIIFWIIYIAVILIIVLVILGFVLEWSKYIPLGITAGYSLVAAGIFGFLRFATPGMVAKSSAFSELFSQIPLSESLMSSMASKMIACFYGPAFLVAMIIAILSLVWSVVCMFVGGSEQPVNPPVPPQPPIDGVPRYDPDWAANP